MRSEQRVLSALGFGRPDRIPVYDSFWPEFVDVWRREKGFAEDADIREYYGLDLEIVIPDETPFPGQRTVLERNGNTEVVRTGWRSVQRCGLDTKFYQELQVALPDKREMDRPVFESPLLDSRYSTLEEVEGLKRWMW